MDSEAYRINSVDFLLNAASILPTGNRTLELLKSYYLTKSRKLSSSEQNQHISVFSDEEMCRKCCTPWSSIKYSMSIAPIKLSKRKALKIQAQINDKSSRKSYFAKRQAKKINNIATIKCNLCGNKNKTMLWKKHAHEITKEKLELSHKITAQEKQVVAKSSDSLHKPAKKKRRKNDKNAGLLYTLKEETKRVCKEPTFSTVKCKPAELTAKLQKMKFPNINLNADKKKKKNQSHPSQNMVVHQKQKRNSLLQLANALKSKDHLQNASSNNDKLRQLFK